ncbi:MAG: VCBS repeat-containing protein [Planctomycetota bacterium]
MTSVSRILLLAAPLMAPAAAQFSTGNIIGLLGGAAGVESADLNGDGIADVVGVGYSSGRLVWHAGLGGGAFAPQQLIASNVNGARHVVLFDVDGDGDLDPAIVVEQQDKVVWYPNLGSSGFGSERIITATQLGPFTVEFADLNGDGNPDALVSSFQDDTVAWYAGDGSGNFGGQNVVSNLADQSTAAVVGDFDLDGDLDVAAANYAEDRLDWFRNNGSGSFSGRILITTDVDGIRRLEAGDLNGDGRLDLLTASEMDDDISWFRGLSGGFGSEEIIDANTAGAGGVSFADLDADGRVDVLAGAIGNNGRAAWHRGLGNGQFGGPQIIDAGNFVDGTIDIIPADLDGDGDLDVLVASLYEEHLVWFENQFELGNSYCSAVPNSTGFVGRMSVTGSPIVTNNNVVLNAERIPPNSFGLFILSLNSGFFANPGGSQGNLCLSGQVGRFDRPGETQQANGQGRFLLPINLGNIPSPSLGQTQAFAGETWHFQAWHRDTVMGASTSNFTNGVRVSLQ